MSADESEGALERAIAEVYRGSLEDFVRRRDALAKELRSSGKREAAATVKALKKPSRIAWALNLAALETPEAIESVVAAVDETAGAQAGGGDVRAAIGGLRAAVRGLASRAAHAAEQAGQRIEAGALGNALFAVLGDAESFALLRRGQLADVPEAGGLDLLTTLLAPVDRGAGAARAPASTTGPTLVSSPSLSASASQKRAALEAAARQAVREAASALAAARERASVASEALATAEAKLQAAEGRLRKVEEEARASRTQRDRARQDAEAATAHLLDAESAAAEAERRLSAAGQDR